MNESIQVVTCLGRMPDPVSEPWYFYEAWLASLARFGVAPTVLDAAVWGGLGDNAKRVKRALDVGLIRSRYMIFANCFDLLFAAAPAEIIEKWNEMRCPPTPDGLRRGASGAGSAGAERITFGAEKHCFSDPWMAQFHPKSGTSYKYLNSGCYIGETEAVHEALEEMDPEINILDDHPLNGAMAEDNDQIWWQRQMRRTHRCWEKNADGPGWRMVDTEGRRSLCGPIGLDHGCALIQNFHEVGLGEIELGTQESRTIKNVETGTHPLIWHLNGNGKNVWKEKLIAHLGL